MAGRKAVFAINWMEVEALTKAKHDNPHHILGIHECIDDVFVIHDIKVIESDKGLFIAMPSRKTSTGGYRDIAHPINPEVRSMFEDAILEAYENAPDVDEDEDEEEDDDE